MTEKRFVMYEHKDNDYILDTPNTSLDFIEMLGDALSSEEIVDRLNEQDNEIQRCKLAYNQLASYVDANFDEYMTQKKLNERIKELEKENKQLQIEIMGQSEEIEILSDENKRLKCINKQLEERLDKSIALDMSQCGDVK